MRATDLQRSRQFRPAALSDGLGFRCTQNIQRRRPVAREHTSNSLRCRAVLSPEKPAVKEDAGALQHLSAEPAQLKKTAKPRVIVLGSGWGAVSFVKALSKKDSQNMELVLISPCNYFLYTPLLPSAATGTVEERSIVEPIRRIVKQKGSYYEAVCQSIDPVAKTITAAFPESTDLDSAPFTLPYDVLVLGVGSINNTFGCPGVEEHTQFFKSVEDARKFRRKVLQCFERAALPQTSSEMREQLLSFVVTGGGPTGVEVAAELHDMVLDDMRKIYPDLIKHVRIRIIELQDHVLSTYDRAISAYTAELFSRTGIELVLNSKVQSVSHQRLTVAGPGGKTEVIPFGAAIWATGVAMHPLMRSLQAALPEGAQTHFRSIVTNGQLQVNGSGGSIYAIGDAATIEQDRALAHAAELWGSADLNGDGSLSLKELRDLLRSASRQYSHMEEHSRFLDGPGRRPDEMTPQKEHSCIPLTRKFGGGSRWGGMVKASLAQGKAKEAPPAGGPSSVVGDLDESTVMDKQAFESLLGKIDRGLRALPATAQVAAQQGQYLAKLLAKHGMESQLPPDTKPFKYGHKGSLAYVGQDKAVMDVPQIGPITGYTAGLLWKGFESVSQVSLRNRLLVVGDWARAKLFGRDISSV